MTSLKKIFYITLGGLLLLIFGGLSILQYQKLVREHELAAKTDITSPEGIQLLEEWMINGNRQWVSIRGQDRNNPIILMVHGGPGSADLALARYMDFETEKNFVVIRWDQRNAGKSFSLFSSAGDLTPELYVADLHELVRAIKKRFSRERIYIVGHSWGTILTATVASRYPEDFYACVNVGQFVNGLENERGSYAFTLREAEKDRNEKAIRELKAIGPPPYGLRETGVQREWLNYYGGGMFYGAHRHDSYQYFGQMMFSSPEYSLVDIIRFFGGVTSSLFHIWPAVEKVNVARDAPEFRVPVYFLLGRHDYNTPTELAVQYLQRLKAPHKELIWFEGSAHAPNYEEPEAFGRALARIKSETLNREAMPTGQREMQ